MCQADHTQQLHLLRPLTYHKNNPTRKLKPQQICVYIRSLFKKKTLFDRISIWPYKKMNERVISHHPLELLDTKLTTILIFQIVLKCREIYIPFSRIGLQKLFKE